MGRHLSLCVILELWPQDVLGGSRRRLPAGSDPQPQAGSRCGCVKSMVLAVSLCPETRQVTCRLRSGQALPPPLPAA